MEERLIAILDDCLVAIRGGETVEDCLARYPDVADELSSLLRVALALEHLPQPGPSAATSSAAKASLLSDAESRRVQPKGLFHRLSAAWSRTFRRPSFPLWMAPVRALATAALALALVFLIGSSVIYAASGSLPGDPLYGFKLLGEDVQRALALSSTNRYQLEKELSARRLREVEQLLASGRQETVIFGGILQARSEEAWWVEAIPVYLNPDTRIQAEPTANSLVEIHGITRADGTVLALLVEIEGEEIIGRIEAINPGTWQIAGKYFAVDGKTYVQRRLQVGDCAEVHARHFSDGSWLALEIERTDTCQENPGEQERGFDDGTPTPIPTSTPTPTPTSTPSPTPEPESDDDKENAVPTIEVLPDPNYPPAAPLPTPAAESDDDRDEDDEQERGEDQDDDDDAGQGDEDDGDPQEDDDDDQDDDGDDGDDDDSGDSDDDEDDHDGDGNGDDSGDSDGDEDGHDGDGDDEDSRDSDGDESDHDDDEEKGDDEPGD